MATNYQQDGKTLDYQNAGAKDIFSGDVVLVGALVGVAHDDIPVGLWGVLHTSGIFVLPKAAEAISTGQKLYLAEGRLTADSGEVPAPPEEPEVPETPEEPEAAKAGKAAVNPLVGTAWASAGAGDGAVAVRLGY